ncbi:O-antigen ligase family protein [Nocardioides jishulii]|uniref:O-antigen ligase family protein n=1 Tax=Nocardioides jishulii TaxID=2575440 RepID=A0A4U2YH66_9ACTN|nr:O-antigen ligase family protein [Nocardioides jishulii]QCX26653.1 O-antigen ligase family protein [Nocardioides jishulii]TKI60377.1 O-antigen ligase family protein [Nocardioides jishulii]
MSTVASPRSGGGTPRARPLPAWPFVALFAPFLVWWALGISDSVWILAALVMAYHLFSHGGVRAPRGFGIWLLLMAWITVSTLRVTAADDLIGAVYRLALYYSLTVLFLYVYNARTTLTVQRVTGVLTLWFVTLVIGGYLGILFPAVEFATPMSRVVPGGLLDNPMIRDMVVKGFSEFDDGYFQLEPRPNVPFLYTNNWGNVYSLLLPVVAVHMFSLRGSPRFWPVALLFPISAVPALLTLNRGMFIGIGVTLVYVAVRLALQRRFMAILGVMGLGLLALVLYNVLPIAERLDNRLPPEGNSTTTRLSLYEQALGLVPGSPIFGYGGPQPPANPFEAPVGTQGYIWMLLVSFGPMAVLLFISFFAVAILKVAGRPDRLGIAFSAVLVVGLVEHLYYGLLPNGLAVMLPVAALVFRDEVSGAPPGQGEPVQLSDRPNADSRAALRGA